MLLGIEHGWGVHVYAGEGDGTDGMMIAHNTFVGANPYNPGHILLASPWVNDTVVINNIFVYPTDAAIVTWEVGLLNIVASHNLVVDAEMTLGDGAELVELVDNLFGPDPGLADADALDFHLRSDSVARDAGVLEPSVAQDFDGRCRPQGEAPDLGAFEREQGNGSTS